MDVEEPLGVVDFTTEKDSTKSKKNKKRKRVGNRLPIGEKIAKDSDGHDAPHSKRSASHSAEDNSADELEGTSTFLSLVELGRKPPNSS